MTLHPSWRLIPADIRTQLAMSVTAIPAREGAFRVVDALQTLPAFRQLEAVSAALVILCRGAGLNPHELVARAVRQVPDIEAVESAASAISDYAKGELL